MIYAHSGSDIEAYLSKQLSKVESVVDIRFGRTSHLYSNFIGHDTLLYSCLNWTELGERKQYAKEYKFAEQLASCAKESGVRRVVLLTYPGAYINSDNSFLAHRARIDQLFQNCGLQSIVFKVQAVYASHVKLSSLYSLFFSNSNEAFSIPNRVTSMVYSVSIERLMQALLATESYERSASFDLFDQVHHLPKFLEKYHPNISIQRYSPALLKVKAIARMGVSSPMLDLFLRPFVPMHNQRVKKELHLDLTPVNHTYSEVPQAIHFLDNSLSMAM